VKKKGSKADKTGQSLCFVRVWSAFDPCFVCVCPTQNLNQSFTIQQSAFPPSPGLAGWGISPRRGPADEYLRENSHFLTTLLFSPLKFAISFFNFE
jgi:hypothetical protein